MRPDEQKSPSERETSEAAGDQPAARGKSPLSRVAWMGMPLPPPLPQRWLPHRKAEVIAAVGSGLLSLDEALERYSLSMEEYLSWQRRIGQFGLAGLRVQCPQPRLRSKTSSVDREEETDV